MTVLSFSVEFGEAERTRDHNRIVTRAIARERGVYNRWDAALAGRRIPKNQLRRRWERLLHLDLDRLRFGAFFCTVNTIFEDSHIPLNIWLIAIYLMCSSKKGISAHQLHRMLKITYKSAWFMCHRVRYAMQQPAVVEKLTGTVEADECYIGGKRTGEGSGRPGPDSTMRPVLALVERGGRVRSFHMKRVTGENLREVLTDNIEASAILMTDEYSAYRTVGKEFAKHETVNHSQKEYARGNVSTNTIEGFFGLLKRGINGIYHHVGPNHLHRYLAEFDFRYNARKVSDGDRTDLAMSGFRGKRLKYRD